MDTSRVTDELVKQAGGYNRAAKKALEIGDHVHWQYCRDQLHSLVRVASAEPESWVFNEVKAMLDDTSEGKESSAA